MRQFLHASAILTASVAVTIAVLALILPQHPAAGGAERVAASTIRPAVFSDGMDSRVVSAVEPSSCPYLAARAAAPACPYLAATASSACPYFAGRATGAGCPYQKGQRGKGADGICPYVQDRDRMSEKPQACPRGEGRQPSLPADGPEKPRYPQLASLGEPTARGPELS